MAGLNIPSGAGGLMRYSDEYKSKLMIDPKYVVVMIIAAILFIIALKVFWPIA